MGFGILTLAITYVIVGVYEVLQKLGVLTAGLYHQAQDTDDSLSILCRISRAANTVVSRRI